MVSLARKMKCLASRLISATSTPNSDMTEEGWENQSAVPDAKDWPDE